MNRSCSTEETHIAPLQVDLMVDRAVFGGYGFVANDFYEQSSERNSGAEVRELTEAGEVAFQAFNAEPLLVDNEKVRAKK